LALASTKPRAARSRTLRASSSGWKAKSKPSRPLWWGSPRELQGVAEPPALPDADLLLQQQVEEVQVAHGLLLGPGDQRLEVLTQVGKPQPVGMLADAGGDQFAHRRPPAWS
jgi:hypothetical protein